MTRAFFDTNVLVYTFDEDARGAAASRLLDDGGVISVQSLNELANVLLRKRRWTWEQVTRATQAVTFRCPEIITLTPDLHRLGLRFAERYRLSVYDAMIAAAALTAECDTLYSEDMHDGLLIDGRVRIVNPFAPVAG
ncbi:PIN domain-containing protein [Sphingomonas sp. S6]|uniref:PIN domain-containing protein n=1 Tax=Sphingomonas sp. S6 TaxID=3368600 RepID=UPI000FC1CC95|nr:PIN domain-containing protein [uncultured Sphingomonas sp.]RTL23107.1 MAG: PIN domain-containing protein [Sphingomonadaceae bacterium]